MKPLKILILFLCALCLPCPAMAEKACAAKGIKLYGKVKVVERSADLKVKVDAFPDLKVKMKSAFPGKCGEWKFVERSPDFTIQFVTSSPDLKIKFVNAFPGMR